MDFVLCSWVGNIDRNVQGMTSYFISVPLNVIIMQIRFLCDSAVAASGSVRDAR